jgi:hypothetical protein
MYRLLLPPDANAQRHIPDDSLTRSGYWAALFHTGWDVILHWIAPGRR